MEKQIYLDGRKMNLIFAIRSKVPMAALKLLRGVCDGTSKLERLKETPETAEWFAANQHRITVVSSF